MIRRTSRLPVSRRGFLAGSAALATGALSMPHIARAAASVKIGIIHPVTGGVSYSGTQGRVGAQMAVQDINAAGGINGKKLVVVSKDDGGKPADAQTAANEAAAGAS